MKPRVQFTRHATKRFVERFPHLVYDKENPTACLASVYYKSVPENGYLNNSKKMVELGEKYGYHAAFDITAGQGVIFICREGKLITVVPQETSIHGGRQGYKPRRKKQFKPKRKQKNSDLHKGIYT